MKRKSARKGARKKTRNKNILAYIIAGILTSLILLSAVTFYNHLPRKEKFCANSITCINDLSGAFDEKAQKGIFMGKEVSIPASLAKTNDPQPVLGDNTSVKQIYVDLTTQHLYAYEDNKLMYDFTISSGKWAPTPTGHFTIWSKLKYTRMAGGNPAIGTYYNLPNVPDVMFFSNSQVGKSQGFSIHGAYWHNNFGHPMSHGCINMKLEDAAVLFNWANPPTQNNITYATTVSPGTEVIIYGQAPQD